jgi:hypothetical protein
VAGKDVIIKFGIGAVGGTTGPGTEKINASFWIDPRGISRLIPRNRRDPAPKSRDSYPSMSVNAW